NAVLKPCFGCDGIGVSATGSATVAQDWQRVTRRHPAMPFLLQERLPEIAEGEISCVFIDGRFAHAVLTRPAPGEFRINTRFRPQPPARFDPPAGVVDDARKVIEAMPAMPLYARVDGVSRGGRLICLEAEV